jgi:hypothetical protein
MAKPKRTPPPGFDDLSVDEQIDYLQALWDRIAGTKGSVFVDLEAASGKSVTWEQAREEIVRRLSEG